MTGAAGSTTLPRLQPCKRILTRDIPSAIQTASGVAATPPVSVCRCWWFPLGPGPRPRTATPAMFPEPNFGMSLIYPRTNYYADANAPDGANGNTPLSDFFPLPLKQPRPFVSIPVPQQYDYTCFQHFAKCTGIPAYVPTGPDDDNAADQ